ncbi:hypothetical protein GJ744_004853 [Endocarpon pusillum]|uniref:Uncharacterized protein n=1 Tax=Endocarpon pusillum TaxID=364733 RepID=A0A8H7E7Q3_9EURO|nr:hypothetical protein GJ744_004853 [Endocarpon pusillum]
MSQRDLEAAITSLEASSKATERQGEILKAQRQHLESLKRQRVAEHQAPRTRRLAVQNLSLAVEEKTQALALELTKAEEGLRGTLSQIPALAADYLHHDDSHLQTLTAISAIDADHGNDLRVRVTQLTEKLSQLDREAIECRLNRVYLQQLARHDADQCCGQSQLIEHEVEKDLKSLHVEIPDVAIMAVAQCFRTPLLQALAKRQTGRDAQARSQLEDISNAMTVLIEAAGAFVDRLEALLSYRTALTAYQADFQALAHGFEKKVNTGKQVRRPYRVTTSLAMEDVMKHWNVPVSESGSVEHALWARKRKVEQDVHRSRIAVEDIIRKHHNSLPMDCANLVDIDTGTDTCLLKFEKDIGKLQDSVDRADLAGTEGTEGDECQVRFVNRWT